jgi:hypothetical protein
MTIKKSYWPSYSSLYYLEIIIIFIFLFYSLLFLKFYSNSVIFFKTSYNNDLVEIAFSSKLSYQPVYL